MKHSEKRPSAGQIVVLNKTKSYLDEFVCSNCHNLCCSSIGTVIEDEYFTCPVGTPPYSLLMNCKNRQGSDFCRCWHNEIKCVIV